MKTAVATTSITAYHQTAELRQSEAERMARYILQETDAGRSVWIRKAKRELGWELSNTSRTLNELAKAVFVRFDRRLYRMEKAYPERDPQTGKVAQTWTLVFANPLLKPAPQGVQSRMEL